MRQHNSPGPAREEASSTVQALPRIPARLGACNRRLELQRERAQASSPARPHQAGGGAERALRRRPPGAAQGRGDGVLRGRAALRQRRRDPPLRAAAQDHLCRLLAARVDQQSRRARPPCRPRGCRGAREDAGAGRPVGVPCPTSTHVHDVSMCHLQVALKWLVQQGIAAVTNTARPKHAAEALDLGSFTLSAREMRALSKAR